MLKDITKLKIEKLLDLFFLKGQLSFRVGQLPKDVHYTLVYNEAYNEINLHLTRNKGPKDYKPQIKIFKINRQSLLDNFEAFVINLINTCLTPVDMDAFKKANSYEVGFGSFDDIRNSDLEKSFTKDITEAIGAHLIKKGRREVKVLESFREEFSRIVTSEDFHKKAYEFIQPIAESYDKDIDSGVVVTDDSVNAAIRIDGNWYFLRTDITLFKALRSIVNRKTACHLICKWEDGLERINVAESYADTEPFNNPCRLEVDPLFGHENTKQFEL